MLHNISRPINKSSSDETKKVFPHPPTPPAGLSSQYKIKKPQNISHIIKFWRHLLNISVLKTLVDEKEADLEFLMMEGNR